MYSHARASKTSLSSKIYVSKNVKQNATQYRPACNLLSKINNNSGVIWQTAVTVNSLLKEAFLSKTLTRWSRVSGPDRFQ